jgi:uncharacterized membrane protein YecN with MAPEG domain
MTITLFYAAILIFIFICLTFNVVRLRWKTQQTINNYKQDKNLERAIRAHGHFSEFVPLSLIAIYMVEATQYIELTHILGMLLVIARLSHAFSILYVEPVKNIVIFRMIGMVTNITILVISAFVYLKFSLAYI